jgi:hypothetical protein
MKKVLRKIGLGILIIISTAVIYTMVYRSVFIILENRAVKNDERIDFSGTGGGLTWINPSADKTLFFIPSSRESAVENLYGDWLKEIHTNLNVNIIVPPVSTGHLIPSLKGEDLKLDGRTREILFFYDLYSRMLGEKHEITVITTGDGSLQALELAKAGVKADKYVLLSPVHNDRTDRGRNLFLKIASFPFLNYLLPWLPESYGKNRAGANDILNDQLNEDFYLSYSRYYPRFVNTGTEADIDRKARQIFESLSTVKANRFFILYGDDDMTYSLEGFERMGDALKAGGSEVTIMRINSSGRMLIFDNGRGRILDLLSILLQ